MNDGLNVCITRRFRKSAEKLTKEFPNLISDIQEAFNGKNFDDVFNHKYVISTSGNAKMIKFGNYLLL